jgi:hypothetical protein
MSIAHTETAILARLAQQLATDSVLLGTYDAIDFTDDAMPVVVGQVRLEHLVLADAVRGDAAIASLSATRPSCWPTS